MCVSLYTCVSSIMCDVSVETNVALDRNLSGKDFELLQTINAYFKKVPGRNRSDFIQQSGIQTESNTQMSLFELIRRTLLRAICYKQFHQQIKLQKKSDKQWDQNLQNT